MLRHRVPEKIAAWPDPIFGVNLRDSLGQLKPGEAEKMGNCFYDGGIRIRLGSATVTAASRGAFMGRGGLRVYPQTASKFRLIAFDTNVVTVSDAGAYGTVTFTLTSDKDTFFRTWSITDNTYVCNKANVLGSISPSQAYTTVTGVNIPASPTMATPFLDRLFAIQGDGIWSTNPRSDTTWSPNSSTWAIYRPAGGTGPPTALHLHSITGLITAPLAQLLIFQESSVTALTGSDFGSDVTLATPPTTWDATLTLLSPNIGTKSPASVVTVPGVGTFWFTQDANVAWLSFTNVTPKLVGDKLFSNRTDLQGINNVNFNQLSQVRMVYHNRKLKLCLPVGSNAYSTIQYWLDLRQLQTVPALEDLAQLSWSGPHTGQSLSAMWVENAGADNDALYACEGNTVTGFFLYALNQAGTYTDASGATTAAVQMDYRSFYHTFGEPSFEKWIPLIRFDTFGSPQNARVALKDLHGNLVSNLNMLDNNGNLFGAASANYYQTGLKYNTGYKYGVSRGQLLAQTIVESQGTSSIFGSAIQVQISTTGGNLIVNRSIPQVQVRRTVPVP